MTDNAKLAELFHDTYERLAPSFGYSTRDDTKQFDPESANGRLMIAVCGEIIRAGRLREVPEGEYICTCGIRVSPHRCPTGSDF